MKILIAEDDDISRQWLETTLASWGYDVVVAADGDEAWRILEAPDAPLIAVLDWHMPRVDGIEICRRMKSDLIKRYGYIIMLTKKTSTQELVEALQAGADDFISKPYDPDELRVRIRAGIRITELQQELLVKASHDELTGLFNRRMLLQMSNCEIDRCKRANAPFAVLLLDLDFFKTINDCFGHLAGDAVLREVALRFKAAVRSIDITGRYGGEEFMAVLPHCDLATAMIVAERVRLAIANQPIRYLQLELKVTVSIGVASTTTFAFIDLQHLIYLADSALYLAKKNGRNCVHSPDEPRAHSGDMLDYVL